MTRKKEKTKKNTMLQVRIPFDLDIDLRLLYMQYQKDNNERTLWSEFVAERILVPYRDAARTAGLI